MPKKCKEPGCEYPVFGKGYCKIHQWRRTDIKKSINAVSDKRKGQVNTYKSLRKKYLSANPMCEVKNCCKFATEIHHKRHNRTNDNLNDVSQFMSVCRGHHSEIHENPKWAKENKYLI